MIWLLWMSLAFGVEHKDFSKWMKEKKYDQVIKTASKKKDLEDNTKKLVVQAVMNKLKDKKCDKTFTELQVVSKKISWLKEQDTYRKKFKQEGFCVYKKEKNKKAQEKIAGTLLKFDSSLIQELIFFKDYDDKKDRLYTYLKEQAGAAKINKKIEQYIVGRSEKNKLNPLQLEVVTAYNLKDAISKNLIRKLDKSFKDQLKKGEYKLTPEDQIVLENTMELEGHKDLTVVKFIVLSWLTQPKLHGKLDPYYDLMEAKTWLEAEKAMISLKPKKSFWFLGKGWNNEDTQFRLKSYFSLMTGLIKDECTSKNYVKLSEAVCKELTGLY
jgi:hypothetical protein